MRTGHQEKTLTTMITQELVTLLQQVTFNYLNFTIQIELPNPHEDNTVRVAIYRVEGTYDSSLYNSFLTNYQFSADNLDPNNWVLEAIETAIATLKRWDVAYFSDCDTLLVSQSNSEEDLEMIPF